jgi:hypothetical protein
VTDLPGPVPKNTVPKNTVPSTPVPSTPAGWYPDHTGAAQLRWWDGEAWTENLRATAEEPVSGAAPYSLRPVATTVPAGTPVYNAFIWMITLLPILGTATLLTFNDSVLTGFLTVPSAIYQDPGYLATLALGWVVYGAAVVLAYLDRRRLLRDGYDRPFHWAWTFFNGGVYVIGRSIIVGRRAGRGRAPIWVWIAIMLIVTVLAVVRAGQMIVTLTNTISFSG